jgi:hypothetical protein
VYFVDSADSMQFTLYIGLAGDTEQVPVLLVQEYLRKLKSMQVRITAETPSLCEHTPCVQIACLPDHPVRTTSNSTGVFDWKCAAATKGITGAAGTYECDIIALLHKNESMLQWIAADKMLAIFQKFGEPLLTGKENLDDDPELIWVTGEFPSCPSEYF